MNALVQLPADLTVFVVEKNTSTHFWCIDRCNDIVCTVESGASCIITLLQLSPAAGVPRVSVRTAGDHASMKTCVVTIADAAKIGADVSLCCAHADCHAEAVLHGVSRSGTTVFRGGVGIEGLGHSSTVSLKQNVLLTEPHSKAEVSPGLLVSTNDVQASHAATVSALSNLDLFACSMRGLTEHAAKLLLIEGFLFAALPSEHSEEFQAHIVAALSSRD